MRAGPQQPRGAFLTRPTWLSFVTERNLSVQVASSATSGSCFRTMLDLVRPGDAHGGSPGNHRAALSSAP